MQVKVLVKLLQEYNQDKEVVVTWEGIFRYITRDNIYLAANGTLVIDADSNSYKEEIRQGKLEYLIPDFT